MRILYVFRSLAVGGGVERVLVDKMNYLSSKYGYEVYMLTTDQGTHPIPYSLEKKVHLEDLGINIYHQYRYHGIKRLLVARRLAHLYEQRLSERLHTICPNVIVCTMANSLDINILARLKGNIPLVAESHSIFRKTICHEGLKNRFFSFMYQKGLSKAQVVVTLTENDAIEWSKVHSCVKIIPNMVHLNKGALSSLDQKNIIWVGRFDYQKRPMEMIEIWQKVYPQFPDWHLYIYGEGELRQDLENVSCSIDMNIHICQPTDKIFDRYRSSSVLVSTSLFEPFGLVIPEAMSCGLPVVAFNCPYGPASIISDGLNGFLVKMDDQEMMIRKLCMLMDDRSLRQRLGHSAYESSLRYSDEIIMPLWKNLFKSLSSL